MINKILLIVDAVILFVSCFFKTSFIMSPVFIATAIILSIYLFKIYFVDDLMKMID